MTQEEKNVLTIDLSTRLPYKVKVQVTQVPIGLLKDETLTYNMMYSLDESDEYITIKPYLRPMSSMTGEEIDEFTQFDVYADGEYIMPNYRAIDWLNAHHFDFRGLLEMGLAIEAPDGMY